MCCSTNFDSIIRMKIEMMIIILMLKMKILANNSEKGI